MTHRWLTATKRLWLYAHRFSLHMHRPFTLTAFVVMFAASARDTLAAPPATVGDLFATHEPLALELTFDRRALCRPRPRKPCGDTPAVLSYRAPTGLTTRLEVRLKARGKWRNKHCDVPPLFLDLEGAVIENGPFAGHPVLALTTHCRTGSSQYDQYLLKEYLAYRLYGLFTDKSLRVRLARIAYRDSGSGSGHGSGRRGRVVEHFGFFVEHFERLAARHGARLYSAQYSTEGLRAYRVDADEVATLALFQYLIGNTDWSAVAGHNVVHIRDAGGLVTAIPYDFDFSGLVNARYASPPPSLPLRTVRQRLFRGFCDPTLDWERLFANFAIRQGAIESLTRQVPALAPTERKSIKAYLGEFFDIVASPELRRDKIVAACRPSADARSRFVPSKLGHILETLPDAGALSHATRSDVRGNRFEA